MKLHFSLQIVLSLTFTFCIGYSDQAQDMKMVEDYKPNHVPFDHASGTRPEGFNKIIGPNRFVIRPALKGGAYSLR